MRSNSQKIITIVCLVCVIVASMAIAEDKWNAQQRPQGGQGRYNQGDANRRGQGGPAMRGGAGMRGQRQGQGMQGMGIGMGSGRGDGLIPGMIRQRLNLTEEQTAKLDDIQQGQIKENMELSNKLDNLRGELEEAISKGNKEAVVKIAQDIGKIIAETALLKISAQEKLKEILNETQLKRIETFNQQRRESREKMKKMMEQRMNGQGERPGIRGSRDGRDGRGKQSQ